MVSNKSPVDDKVLETKDVQQPDRPANAVALAGRRSVYGGIDFIHDPDKEPPVDPLQDEPQLVQLHAVNNPFISGISGMLVAHNHGNTKGPWNDPWVTPF